MAEIVRRITFHGRTDTGFGAMAVVKGNLLLKGKPVARLLNEAWTDYSDTFIRLYGTAAQGVSGVYEGGDSILFEGEIKADSLKIEIYDVDVTGTSIIVAYDTKTKVLPLAPADNAWQTVSLDFPSWYEKPAGIAIIAVVLVVAIILITKK